MPERQPTESIPDDRIDTAILEVLLDEDAQRPWSVDEVGREIEDPIAAADGLDRLTRSGLVHQLNGFVFALRAAKRAVEVIPNELR